MPISVIVILNGGKEVVSIIGPIDNVKQRDTQLDKYRLFREDNALPEWTYIIKTLRPAMTSLTFDLGRDLGGYS